MQLTYVRIAVFRGYPMRVYQRFRRFFGEFFHIHNFALLAVFCRAPCRMFYDFRSPFGGARLKLYFSLVIFTTRFCRLNIAAATFRKIFSACISILKKAPKMKLRVVFLQGVAG